MNRGVRPETFYDIIRELNSVDYFEQMIDREYRLASGEAKEQDESSVSKGSLFSNFSDRQSTTVPSLLAGTSSKSYDDEQLYWRIYFK